MDIYCDGAFNDPHCRNRAYKGDLFIFPPRPSTLALVHFARDLIESAFSPRHPQHAHESLEVSEAVEILTNLNPDFIHPPKTRTLLQRLLLDLGCDPGQTYQDVPRLRVAYPAK